MGNVKGEKRKEERALQDEGAGKVRVGWIGSSLQRILSSRASALLSFSFRFPWSFFLFPSPLLWSVAPFFPAHFFQRWCCPLSFPSFFSSFEKKNRKKRERSLSPSERAPRAFSLSLLFFLSFFVFFLLRCAFFWGGSIFSFAFPNLHAALPTVSNPPPYTLTSILSSKCPNDTWR